MANIEDDQLLIQRCESIDLLDNYRDCLTVSALPRFEGDDVTVMTHFIHSSTDYRSQVEIPRTARN